MKPAAPLWQHRQRDGSFGPFQDAHGFFVRDPLQGLPVDRHDLVAPLQPPVFRRCSLIGQEHAEWVGVDGALNFAKFEARRATCLSEDCFDVDGQVSVRAAAAPDDTEAQAIRPSAQGDGFILRWAGRVEKQWVGVKLVLLQLCPERDTHTRTVI